jgi:hypothetical protein
MTTADELELARLNEVEVRAGAYALALLEISDLYRMRGEAFTIDDCGRIAHDALEAYPYTREDVGVEQLVTAFNARRLPANP